MISRPVRAGHARILTAERLCYAAVIAALAAMLLLGGLFLPGGGASPDAARAAPLRVEDLNPANLRPLKPSAALAINRRLPFDGSADAAAAPFRARFAAHTSRLRSLDCLTQAIYYEAANEPADGQRAVAQVVLNRVAHRAYPNSVCGVVYQGSERATGCQFTFTCDGSLARRPSVAGWARARAVAEAALAGFVFAPVGHATHYHADYVVPYWASSLLKAAVFGSHIFYRPPGSLGRAGAFSSPYAGVEPDVSARIAAAATAGTLAPPAGGEDPAALRDYASATFVDFDELATRPSEDKAAELDSYGLLDYRAKTPVAGAAAAAPMASARTDPAAAADAAIASALSAGKPTRRPVPEPARLAPPAP